MGNWLHDQIFSSGGFWLTMLGWLLGVLFWALLALAVVFCFVPMATFIATPFNDILSEKVERLYTGSSVDAFSARGFVRALAIGLHSSLRIMLLTFGLLACAMLLNLIPGIGPALAAAASAAITIRFLALQFTAYSMDRRLFTYAQRREFLRRNRARTIGLGSMAFLVMLVPVLNALFIPVSAVAGTLLFCDTQRPPARPGPLERAG
jgi:CysZ protein